MRMVLKCASVLLALTGLSTTSYADPTDCGTLQEYWNAWSAAQAAENAYPYLSNLDQAYLEYLDCSHRAGFDASPYQAQLYCDQDYDSKKMNIEDEYQQLHNETLITGAQYQFYASYLEGQAVYCQISG